MKRLIQYKSSLTFIRSAGCLTWDYVDTEKTHTEHTQTSMPNWDSNPRSQCWSGRKQFVPQTAPPPRSASGLIWNAVNELSVIRVPGYISIGPGSIPGATRIFEKWWVWNGVHSASWVQLRSYFEEIIAAPLYKTEITAVGDLSR
jgi:hypothetical protein